MFKVFISHSSIDTWVAKQIALQIVSVGASTFLDEADIAHGDDFEDNIREAAQESNELFVLFTPWSTTRPYIWLELGMFWGSQKRIVAVLHGITPKELSSDERIPILLKKTDMLTLNEIDSYFSQLKARVEAAERGHE